MWGDRVVNTPAAVCPPKFRDHEFTYSCDLNRSMEKTWAYLMTPETFTKGQVWPWRVEFIDTPREDGSIASGFDVGTLNAHHGPFMNFCGVISLVEESDDVCLRHLDYGYGAYAIGFRFIRPVRLIIKVESTGPDACHVTVTVRSHVRRSLCGTWTLMQRLFWPSFKRLLRRGIR